MNNERFWSKVEKHGPGQCWPWIAGTNTWGYGNFKVRGKTKTASRIAWELANGQIPDGMCVLHTCDNPPCCNPDHLSLGTHQDNIADRDAKGRQMRGTRMWKSRLEEQDVLVIRKAKPSGISKWGCTKELADRFGVSVSTINRIWRAETWKHT